MRIEMNLLTELVLKRIDIRVNRATGILHPNDESFVKTMFKWLYKQGESLNSDEISRWAIEHNWPAKHAKELGDLGENIGNGKRVVIKNPPSFKENYFEDLLREASK